MRNISTERVKIVFQTDWKLMKGYEIVEFQKDTDEYSYKIFRFGDRVPILKRKIGYTVNMNPCEIQFETRIISKNKLPYHVKADLVCRCIDSVEIAKRFHEGEDSLAVLLDQKKQFFWKEAQKLAVIDRDICHKILLHSSLHEIISVRDINNLELIDQSKNFTFWLHSGDVTLNPVDSRILPNNRIRITAAMPSTPSRKYGKEKRVRVVIPAGKQDTVESTHSAKVKILPSDASSDIGKKKRVRFVTKEAVQNDTEQTPKGAFDIVGLEIINDFNDIYTIWVEVFGRTSSSSIDNVQRLRSKIVDHLKLSAEKYKNTIDESWIKITISETPRLEDFHSVIDFVEIPRSPQIIFRSIEFHLGRPEKPLRLNTRVGGIIEIETKVCYITQHKASVNEKEVENYVSEQLEMAVKRGSVSSEEDLRMFFIDGLDLENNYKLKFDSIRYLRFDSRIRSKVISFKETIHSRDGYFALVRASVNCRVNNEEEKGEEIFKMHIISEIKKTARENNGLPQGKFCEQIIQKVGERETGGFVVERVYVEVDDITRPIVVELGDKKKELILKTATGHTYDLVSATIYCRGLKNDNDTKQQISAYLESIIISEVLKATGELTPIRVQEILQDVDYIDHLNVTVYTVKIPDLEVYAVPSSVSLDGLRLILNQAKGYVVTGDIYGHILDEDKFEQGIFVQTLHRYLETRAANSGLDELTSEVCKTWILEFPRFKEVLFALDKPIVKVNETTEAVSFDLACEDNPIIIRAANKETYLIYGHIECTIADSDSVDTESVKKTIIERIKKYIEKFDSQGNDPDDLECENIAIKVGTENEIPGITINKPVVHLRNSRELIEAEKQQEIVNFETTTAYETHANRLKKLQERDSVFYDNFIQLFDARLQGKVEDLKIIREEKNHLFNRLKDKKISRKEYDELLLVLKERENDVLQNISRIEFGVPSQEILKIQEKYFPSMSKQALENKKGSHGALAQEKQMTQEDSECKGGKEEDNATIKEKLDPEPDDY